MIRALAVAAVFLLAGCGSITTQGAHGYATPAPATAAASVSPVTAWPLPNPALTPGAVADGYGLADICPHVNPALEAARPSSAEARQVYQRYGITTHRPGQYEVDHLIPIELLGAPDSPQNLWPEANDTPSPAVIRAEHLNPAYVRNSKDILEDVLHRDVCAGTVPLAVAQHAIAAGWPAAYVKYVTKGGTS